MTGQRGVPPDPGRPDLDVESLLAVLEEFPDPRVRETALELLEAVMGLHRAALARILELVRSHPGGAEIVHTLCRDAVVASLLTSHGLLDGTGRDLEARVRAALNKVRPYMHGHGGDVEVVEVRDGRVSLRLAGACHGCGFSENTLRLGIEQTLRREVPEIGEIVVTGTFERPAGPKNSPPPVPGDSGQALGGRGWQPVVGPDEMPEGTLRVVQTDHGAVLLCAAYGRVNAFRDACPAGGGTLGNGTLIAFILKCPCHDHAFDVRSGRCLTRPDLALEPIPSVCEGGLLRVAV